jgi:biopolymer transport protein ExbB
VVSAGISEALIATAVGLLVAIVSLALFNWLQVRVGGIAASFTRASERFIQALLYVEAAPPAAPDRSAEVADGNLIPARG